jgi:hypothetical protein
VDCCGHVCRSKARLSQSRDLSGIGRSAPRQAAEHMRGRKEGQLRHWNKDELHELGSQIHRTAPILASRFGDTTFATSWLMIPYPFDRNRTRGHP